MHQAFQTPTSRGSPLYATPPPGFERKWLVTHSLSNELPLNRLKPNDPYMGRTAPLASKRCILYIYSTNIGTEYFKHALYSPFFFLFKIQFVS